MCGVVCRRIEMHDEDVWVRVWVWLCVCMCVCAELVYDLVEVKVEVP